MSDSDTEKWAKMCKIGRTQYVLRYGVLGWGVPTAILFVLIQYYFFGHDGFLSQLIPALIIFPIAGILFGRCMWKMLEKKHMKATTTGMKE